MVSEKDIDIPLPSKCQVEVSGNAQSDSSSYGRFPLQQINAQIIQGGSNPSYGTCSSSTSVVPPPHAINR